MFMKHQELCLLHCFYDRVENAELRIGNLIEWYDSMILGFDLDYCWFADLQFAI